VDNDLAPPGLMTKNACGRIMNYYGVAAFIRAAQSLTRWCIAQLGRTEGKENERTADVYGLIFCIYMCQSVQREETASFIRALHDVHDMWNEEAAPGSLLQLPGSLLLPVAILLESHHKAPPAVSSYLRASIEILSESPQDDGQLAALGRLEKQTILSAAGFLASPAPPSSASLLNFVDNISVPVSRTLRAELTLRCEAHTLWGMIPPRLPEADMMSVGSLLRGLAVHTARRYDLAETSRLLRASAHLTGATHPDLVSFILSQQNADGAFGYFAPEAAILKSFKSTTDVNTELYLPVAIEVSLLLSELIEPTVCWLRRLPTRTTP
jgi:hypothetical protein